MENTEKYKMFSVPVEKEIRKVDKDSKEDIIIISYKKIINSARFMASSLSNIVDNLPEWIQKIQWKDCDCFFEYERVKGNLIKYKCSSRNNDYLIKIDTKSKKQFKNTFKFSENNINNFCC